MNAGMNAGNAVRGIFCGLLATGAMTAFLASTYPRAYPGRALPPARLSRELAVVAGAKPRSAKGQIWLSLLAHFGYGAATGMVYALIRPSSRQPLVRGSFFGVAFWAANYLGWMPAFRFRTAAPRMPAKENLLMVAAHLVYGITLAETEKRLRQSNRLLAPSTP